MRRMTATTTGAAAAIGLRNIVVPPVLVVARNFATGAPAAGRPEHRPLMRKQLAVLGQQNQSFDSGLRHQHSAKRIGMVERKSASQLRMLGGDRKKVEVTGLAGGNRVAIEHETARLSLDRNFPDVCSTHGHPIFGVVECCPRHVREIARPPLPPKQYVGVDEKVHGSGSYPNCFNSSGGSGSSKSGEIHLIFMRPDGLRGPFLRTGKGTSVAIGWPWFGVTSSSPEAART